MKTAERIRVRNKECNVGRRSQQKMENSSSALLKKLKREAAQRRKAQARSLKLRAEEQERLQRLVKSPGQMSPYQPPNAYPSTKGPNA